CSSTSLHTHLTPTPCPYTTLFRSEHGEQAPVAGIEVEVVLVRLPEIGLLEHERHAEHALPEVDGALPGRADDRGVMDTLDLDLRSEEHTSELQSLRHLVCRLLLEK